MGRGRQKAKQTKVARELKYFSPETNYRALEQELTSHGHDDVVTDNRPRAAVETDTDDDSNDSGAGPTTTADAVVTHLARVAGSTSETAAAQLSLVSHVALSDLDRGDRPGWRPAALATTRSRPTRTYVADVSELGLVAGRRSASCSFSSRGSPPSLRGSRP